MADKKRQLPDKIVDADGRPTLDFLTFMDDLIYGTAPDSIGTLLSGPLADSWGFPPVFQLTAGLVLLASLVTTRLKESTSYPVLSKSEETY